MKYFTERFLFLPKQKQDQIISRAAEVFDRKGYEASNMAELAKGCQVSIGTLYNYCPSKQDLYLGIFSVLYDETDKALKKYFELDEPYLETIEKLFQETKRSIAVNPTWIQLYNLCAQIQLPTLPRRWQNLQSRLGSKSIFI